ncbi:Crp/Fnr family transcriptional regulator [Sulfurimonas sp. SAG-AH-194-C20]|nr:Crp/Fnr family transcriptional regulator [Sulfurimonas sp. SAG-AH-194-C20]MDF1878941.1 Crp/Fnr family transcriptional regulator [Sulfurimonas sp. SAG-AH-194-C20]
MKTINLDMYPFYDELDSETIGFLRANLKPISLKKDNILFYQGDICDNILFLIRGTVRLYIQSDTADEITLYELKEGEQCIVNTASTMSQTEAIGSAVTLTDIEGYLLDVKSVKELAHRCDEYQSFLFSIYTLRMSSLAKLVNDLQFKQLDERILEWLNKQGNSPIKTTHEYIANELGTTRVVVSRILKELEKKSKVKLSRGIINIL